MTCQTRTKKNSISQWNLTTTATKSPQVGTKVRLLLWSHICYRHVLLWPEDKNSKQVNFSANRREDGYPPPQKKKKKNAPKNSDCANFQMPNRKYAEIVTSYQHLCISFVWEEATRREDPSFQSQEKPYGPAGLVASQPALSMWRRRCGVASTPGRETGDAAGVSAGDLDMCNPAGTNKHVFAFFYYLKKNVTSPSLQLSTLFSPLLLPKCLPPPNDTDGC